MGPICGLLFATLLLPPLALASATPGMLASGGVPTDAAVAESVDVSETIARFATDRADLERFHAVTTSTARLDRIVDHTNDWIERVARIDRRSLDVESRIDLLLLENHLERLRRQASLDRARLDEVIALLPFVAMIADLEEDRRRLVQIGGRDAAARLHAIAVQVDDAIHWTTGQKSLDSNEMLSASIALRAARMLARSRETLAGWFAHHDGFHPEFGWWTRAPYEHLQQRLHECERLLREEIAGQRGDRDDPLVGDPIGRDALIAELSHEFISLSPEALIEIAEREFAHCEALAVAAVDALGRDDWAAALEFVKEQHVAPGEQPAFVVDEARRAVRFLDENDLVTIPDLARELWRLEMLSAEQQRTLPFAAYGPLHMWVAYPTESMDHRRKIESMRGNNRHFTRIVVPHELIPGHHLQLFVAQRSKTHRRLFTTPFLLEGWCLHWEMLLHDLGYADGPEDEIGMLHWRKLRCARIIVSLRFHLGEMEPQEMIDFLVTRVGLERDGATAEVRRYVGDRYSPLYQAAYMLGGLQMRALHEELVGGGMMSQREFHDAVLKCGSIPVPMIRASLWARCADPQDRPDDAHPENARAWEF